ncbi:hypothetical protein CEXT_9801 [Caerostris extrusa]|uniref:Uncharacterized protein n=1 Tax=Caerostris extrusa TaxID=172846 RepID=A0AAV4YEX7_CAEEX|nr:hypothetical protein CEXT_9801 [Caerostris extrusa]
MLSYRAAIYMEKSLEAIFDEELWSLRIKREENNIQMNQLILQTASPSLPWRVVDIVGGRGVTVSPSSQRAQEAPFLPARQRIFVLSCGAAERRNPTGCPGGKQHFVRRQHKRGQPHVSPPPSRSLSASLSNLWLPPSQVCMAFTNISP